MKRGRGDTATRRHGDKRSLRRVSESLHPRVPLITLLTDFGTADYFVGAMKGVILSVNPEARIADITHEIPPQDIAAATFTLLAAYESFPAQTIHLAVVDPGVGSARRPILVAAGGHFFVGPDNGVFSYVIDREPLARILHVTNEDYYRHPVSATFHGRDVFAPVAAALSTGVKPKDLGAEIDDYLRLPPLAPETTKNGDMKGRIIHIDRFGNCITNLTPRELTTETIESGVRLTINGKSIRSFRSFFSEASGSRDTLFAVWGSAGFLEIAAMNKSAAKILKAKRGQTVTVSIRNHSDAVARL